MCPVCGHISPSADATRCNSCWAFLTHSVAIPRSEAERRARRFRLPLWRKRHLFIGLALLLAYSVWKLAALFDVAPLLFPPPAATTRVNAVSGPNTWAQVRQNNQSTGFTEDRAPAPGKVKWKFTTSDALVTTPAVADGRVYFTTEDGRALALDGQSGNVVWEYRTGFPSSSTPAITGELVIFATRPGLVVALDRDTGAERWKADIGDPVLASPIVAEGKLYLGASDRNLYALDAATGRKLWSYATKEWIIAPAAYADGTVAVASQNSQVQILGTRTGRRQLLYDAGRRRSIGGGPVIQGDMFYFGARDGTVWAVDRRARTHPFGRAILFWRVNFYVWGVAPPPVQKGTIWSARIGGEVLHAPAVALDTVYVVNKQGKVAALDAATGKQRWAAEVGAEISAAPTVAGGTVLIGAWDGTVLGLDAGTGEMLWDFKTGGKIAASPAVAGDTIYVASTDGTLYALSGP